MSLSKDDRQNECTHMLLDELQDLGVHEPLHDAPLLNCERKRVEHALQVRQRVEHEQSLVPTRPFLLCPTILSRISQKLAYSSSSPSLPS